MNKSQTSFEWILLFGGAIMIVILAIGVFTGFLSKQSGQKQGQLNTQEQLRDCLTYKAIGNGYYPPFNNFTQAYFPFRGSSLTDAIKDYSDYRRVLSSSGLDPTPGYTGDTEKGLTVVKFNSSQALVFVGGTSGLNINNQFTLEFWFNPSTLGATNYLFRSSYLSVNVGAAVVRLVGSVTDNVPLTVPTTSWTYLAITFDGTNAVIYVNGVSISSQAFSFTSGSGNFSIGADTSSFTNGLNGYLDLVRISNVSRDANAISNANSCEDAINDDVLRT